MADTVKAIQEAMQRFAQAHMLLGSVNDREPADKALCDAIKTHAAAVSAAKDERIKVLEDALRMVAASHAWQLFGECRAFGTDRIPSPGQCHEIARAALGDKT